MGGNGGRGGQGRRMTDSGECKLILEVLDLVLVSVLCSQIQHVNNVLKLQKHITFRVALEIR